MNADSSNHTVGIARYYTDAPAVRRVFTWGDDDYGQLGNGQVPGSWAPLPRSSPAEVSGTIYGPPSAVSAGHTSTLAISGGIYFWGAAYSTTPVAGSPQGSVTPGAYWKIVSLGKAAYVGILTDGTLWSGGPNAWQIGTDTDWDKVSAGNYHTMVIKKDGSLWAWGQNNYGQLGDGTTIDRNVNDPVKIDGKWKEVSAGEYHTVAIREDGIVWAWGRNNEGQLGNGTTINRKIPVRVVNENYYE